LTAVLRTPSTATIICPFRFAKDGLWFKSSLNIIIINKGQSNDCPLSMVGATGPDGGAAHAVNGNDYMSLLLTQKMDNVSSPVLQSSK